MSPILEIIGACISAVIGYAAMWFLIKWLERKYED